MKTSLALLWLRAAAGLACSRERGATARVLAGKQQRRHDRQVGAAAGAGACCEDAAQAPCSSSAALSEVRGELLGQRGSARALAVELLLHLVGLLFWLPFQRATVRTAAVLLALASFAFVYHGGLLPPPLPSRPSALPTGATLSSRATSLPLAYALDSLGRTLGLLQSSNSKTIATVI